MILRIKKAHLKKAFSKLDLAFPDGGIFLERVIYFHHNKAVGRSPQAKRRLLNYLLKIFNCDKASLNLLTLPKQAKIYNSVTKKNLKQNHKFLTCECKAKEELLKSVPVILLHDAERLKNTWEMMEIGEVDTKEKLKKLQHGMEKLVNFKQKIVLKKDT